MPVESIYRDAPRRWLCNNLAPAIFLGAYFLSVVLGNILYALPFGGQVLQASGYTPEIFQFDTIFSSGFWLLLLTPFLITPVVATIAKKFARPFLQKVIHLIPEFHRIDYVILTAVCFGYVFFSLWQADAFSLFSSGSDAISSVEARFQIQAHTGFAAQVVLMSLLFYLSTYALVKWMQEDEVFWKVVTVFNTLVMSVFLTVLNMKWPLLLFYIGLILAIFVYATKHVYLKVTIGSIFLMMTFLFISLFVFRATPEVTPKAPGVTRTAIKFIPGLALHATNRMAISYPYYYEIFTKEGQVCGGIAEQAQVGPACRPSTFIYTRIFGDDGFQGRGTSPAAVHISGYAIGSWPVAFFALFCASLILGLFASLPLNANAAVGTFGIMGALAGYHFSQLPGEGPIFYNHGLAWLTIFLALYFTGRFLYTRLRSARATRRQAV